MFSPMDPSFRMQAIGEDNIVEVKSKKEIKSRSS
jgi:hypothetical protein